MRTSDFDYELPPGRIAQTPAEPRDSARLMVVHRASGAIHHARFHELPAHLNPGDLLVANDTEVLAARLRGRKARTGGAVEALLLRARDPDGQVWETLLRGRVRPGMQLVFVGRDGSELAAEVVEHLPEGGRVVRFAQPIEPLLPALGELPLPPYISRPLDDGSRYQTVFARVAGSAAAPTAGLHFTPGLIAALEGAGVGFAFATLHVGMDTFRPVATDRIEEHAMHREWCALPQAAAEAINAARREGRRVVAVGTTAVRVLETAARHTDADDELAPYAGWTDLFITPGYEFKAVDALITNFHFPRSTLLMLVSAFAGKALVDLAYADALAGDYRFFSFGDAMLLA